MKNPTLPKTNTAKAKANKAVRKIEKLVEESFPNLSPDTKAEVLIECLMEFSVSRKLKVPVK
ncbi:MAG: hypothetical protein ICV66_09625 [Chitinophagaceae bacterium]|nr:hypothetical protein [Chitinophagaceae bacterium]